MIDKIELRLPRVTLFRPAVREFMAESRHFKKSSRTMGSGRYEWVTNLRPGGVDGLCYACSRCGRGLGRFCIRYANVH